MTNRKNILGSIALLSLLLMSQVAVLVHSVEHPFHQSEHACSAFIQGEKSGNALVSAEFGVPVQPSSVLLASPVTIRSFPALSTVYSARAPPRSFL
jgi:hypothetical protein